MNVLDGLLIVAALVSGLVGFRHGLIIAACSLVGFLGGAWVGLQAAPYVLSDAPRVFSTAVAALFVVLVVGAVGSMIGTLTGRRVRLLITWRPGRLLDSTAGALVGIAYVLVFAWAMGVAVASSGLPAISAPVRGSAVLAAVDRALPEDTTSLFRNFTQLLDRSGFPAVFAPFNREPIAPVEPPVVDESVTPAVQQAAASVLRVGGNAVSCSSTLTGTGWVYADDLVVTNAHVVAGVDDPVVVDSAGQTLRARLVTFDAEIDIAVLRVDGLDAPALPFGGELGADDPATVIGYPGGGPLRFEPARVRTQQTIVGPDIYGGDRVRRDVYSLRTSVLPGDSGGPLLSSEGLVVGVIFAASLEDDETGYALTAAQAAAVLDRSLQAVDTVSSGPCA